MVTTFLVTWYCLCVLCCGKPPSHRAYAITASGLRAEVGLSAACPPEMKMGTLIVIDGLGLRVCDDRGGAIKGRRIDVLAGSHAEALKLGVARRRIQVMP